MDGALRNVPESVLQSWIAKADEPVQTRGWDMIIMCSILGLVALVAVGSRIWYRRVIIRKLDVSDYSSIVALVRSFATSSTGRY